LDLTERKQSLFPIRQAGAASQSCATDGMICRDLVKCKRFWVLYLSEMCIDDEKEKMNGLQDLFKKLLLGGRLIEHTK